MPVQVAVTAWPLLPLLLVGPLGPSLVVVAEAGPWDGIVGFLQTVSQLQGRRADPDPVQVVEEDGHPLRKIVYAVEEQVSGNDIKTNGSVIVYDSQRDGADDSNNILLVSDLTRQKRSSDSEIAVSDEQSGRQNGNVVARPFLIGRKLWYVPLWFSLYLILYITALTVKSVARHRIKYPTLVSEDDALAKRRNGYTKTGSITRRVTNAITNAEKRYQPQWRI